MTSASRVLITGISGQDGSYLAESYLEDGWEVHGIVRRSSSMSRARLDEITSKLTAASAKRLHIHYGDVLDFSSLISIIKISRPRHIVNLAAQSHVGISFKLPIDTFNVNAWGALNIFEAARLFCPEARIYQASSSEMYGGLLGRNQLDENDSFFPKSPYAIAKVAAHNYVNVYRDSFNMFLVGGILFNHESPRRGENFVTRKITLTLGKILNNQTNVLKLGNVHAERDWGHARDYIRAVRLMLEQNHAKDYVVSTGVSRSVLQFATDAFSLRGLNVADYLLIDDSQFRPNEVHNLNGNSDKIRRELGWQPLCTYEELVEEMVEWDTRLN